MLLIIRIRIFVYIQEGKNYKAYTYRGVTVLSIQGGCLIAVVLSVQEIGRNRCRFRLSQIVVVVLHNKCIISSVLMTTDYLAANSY